jgi:hypothetical protein
VTILGDLFGYNSAGNDLLGFPEDRENACIVCGMACNAHTNEMNFQCSKKLYSRGSKEINEDEKHDPSRV